MPNHSEKRRHFAPQPTDSKHTKVSNSHDEIDYSDSQKSSSHESDYQTAESIENAAHQVSDSVIDSTAMNTHTTSIANTSLPLLFPPAIPNSISSTQTTCTTSTSLSASNEADDLSLNGSSTTSNVNGMLDLNGSNSGQLQHQFLQLQQQQLQNLSPSELANMASMAQQMALGMMMFPMGTVMPWVNQSNQGQTITSNEQEEHNEHTNSFKSMENDAEKSAADGSNAHSLHANQAMALAAHSMHGQFRAENVSADALGLSSIGNANDAFASLGSNLSMSCSQEEAPRRKRGRPSKQDLSQNSGIKNEPDTIGNKSALGLGMPFMTNFGQSFGFHGNSISSNSDQTCGTDQTSPLSTSDLMASFGASGVPVPNNGSGSSKSGSKKKIRGTGRPRGRPRTRPRPGEVVPRAKLAAIAPANYIMYNYPLTNASMGTQKGTDGMAVHGNDVTHSNQQHVANILNSSDGHHHV
uniref:AlNc14C160G7745 protein n=1 Tax=Albugo laibachii Nc14 TaxID=890382 RepID=F0WMQ9_9STRA|nr:AlNc14C160G7745 [Albugo laibachii Nc14]|eukprot:CCA22594.1 AlNc14C160G7745 [Albugo laibachii Nc14]